MIELAERFDAKWVPTPEGCWRWTACTNGKDYGLFWVLDAGRKLYAHRVSYELYVGPIPEGLTIDHLCRNRWCVRPGHLEPVTQDENYRRGVNARSSCKNGHEYTEENTRMYRGYRRCRACDRENWHRRKATELIDHALFSGLPLDIVAGGDV